MASMDYENENGTRGYEGQYYPMMQMHICPIYIQGNIADMHLNR